MRKVLLVGDSPLGTTGNSNMMRAILGQINPKDYKIAIYGNDTGSKIKLDFFEYPNHTLIPIQSTPNDKWGHDGLLKILAEQQIDVLVFVGIDIWAYGHIFDKINQVRQAKNFIWIFIFPYDLIKPRQDWIKWFNQVQYPCVYSQYGYDLLKPLVPRLKYFRPPLFLSNVFQSLDDEKRKILRRRYFPTLESDDILIGYVGNNQIRKDPQRILMAYAKLRETRKNAYLYLHTEMEQGVFNLSQFCLDLGIKTGEIISKGNSARGWVDPRMLAEIYNCFDFLVNASMQEGLNWTLLEAMLSGVPVIATDTTAQTELVKDTGYLVPCENQTFMPVMGERGPTWVEAKCCSVNDLYEGMKLLVDSPELRQEYKAKGLQKSKEWLKGVTNITTFIDECIKDQRAGHFVPTQTIKKAVLFVQHSAAGDILMTTRCFDGIRRRYGLPLVYMTQKRFMNILEENPHLSQVIEWDETVIPQYKTVLNPHGERILPGHWGRNCNSILADFYWKILDVTPTDFIIVPELPPIEIKERIESETKPIAILHTTGGDPEFRTYLYMPDVAKYLKDKYLTIQVGGSSDAPADAELDLRGKLTYRQTAFVMNMASLSINVDSFISHLAGALGISQITLFGSGNAIVTRPLQNKGESICLVPDYIRDCPGLGPCSASVRNCPATCTGVHNPKYIVEQIQSLEERDLVRRNYANITPGRYSLKYVQ